MEAQDFIQKLLKKDPNERMNIDQMNQHSWIQKSKSKSIA